MMVLRPGGSNGSPGKWSDSGCLLKVELIGFADELDTGYG